MNKAILYYSHNSLDGSKLNDACRAALIQSKLPIISVTHSAINLGTNYVVNKPPSLLSMLENILFGLNQIRADYVFLAEHDCLYHDSHFDTEFAGIQFNINSWRVSESYYHLHPNAYPVLSSFSGKRKILISAMNEKILEYREVARRREFVNSPYPKIFFEPTHVVGKTYKSEVPILNFQHVRNSSSGVIYNNWDKVMSLPYWGHAEKLVNKLGVTQLSQFLPQDFRKRIGLYRKIIVIGPQRSGTRIHAKIIAQELGVDFIDETDFGTHNFEELEGLSRRKSDFVIQAPGITHRAFELPQDVGLVVIMRPVSEIVKSQRRINWQWEEFEKRKFSGVGLDLTQPIGQIKYDYIDLNKDNRTIFIDYGDLSSHPSWRNTDGRKLFVWNQTE